MKDNLFLIESPLQLIMANEAIHEFELKKENYEIKCFNFYDSKNKNQIQKVGEKLKIPNLSFVDIVGNSVSGKLIYFSKVVLKQQVKHSYNTIFIGDVRSILFKAFLNVSKYDNLVILDDGNDSLVQINRFLNGKYAKRSLLSKVKDLIFQYKTGLNKKLILDARTKFFTSYYFDNSGRFVSNNFEKLIALNSKKQIDNRKIYFLGNKTYESGFTTRKYYFQSLKKSITYLTNKWPDAEIFYLPHRGERNENLLSIVKEYNLTLLELDCPIELHLILNTASPFLVASFFSSALDTTNLFFPNIKVVSFMMDLDEFDPKRHKKLNLIYSSYEKSNISIIRSY